MSKFTTWIKLETDYARIKFPDETNRKHTLEHGITGSDYSWYTSISRYIRESVDKTKGIEECDPTDSRIPQVTLERNRALGKASHNAFALCYFGSMVAHEWPADKSWDESLEEINAQSTPIDGQPPNLLEPTDLLELFDLHIQSLEGSFNEGTKGTFFDGAIFIASHFASTFRHYSDDTNAWPKPGVSSSKPAEVWQL